MCVFSLQLQLCCRWTGGSVLARFAFTSPNFLERLKKDFMKKFDADKNGYLDQKEMIRFLAYHVRIRLCPCCLFVSSVPLEFLVGRENRLPHEKL